MPIHVSAFHGAGMLEKLKDLFGPPSNRVFDETLRTECAICQSTFAVFLHIKSDPQNEIYFNRMTNLIAQDCNDGKHSAELTVSD